MLENRQIFKFLRRSPLPYMAVLAISYLAGYHLTYVTNVMSPGSFDIKAQSPGIYVPFLLFPLAFILWLFYRGRPARGWILIFLAGLAVAWIVHMLIIWHHGDLYTHAVWLFVPTLALLALKAPDSASAWKGVVFISWVVAALLLVTRLLEILDIVPMFYIADGSGKEWEAERYWMPLSGYFGLDGRWPGPFGFNSRTGFFSAFILIVAVQRWRWSSLPLGVIGALGIVLTAGRAPYLAAIAGLLILLIFSPKVPLFRHINAWIRVLGVVIVTGAAGLYILLFSGASDAGRRSFWAAYLSEWQEAPWFGIGQIGIWEAGGLVSATMDAHSIFVQSLTRFGILGFASIYGTLALGLTLSVIAASRGRPGPLAIMAAYCVSGFTDVLHDGWLTHSTYSMLLIFSVLATTSSPGDGKGEQRSNPDLDPSLHQSPR